MPPTKSYFIEKRITCSAARSILNSKSDKTSSLSIEIHNKLNNNVNDDRRKEMKKKKKVVPAENVLTSVDLIDVQSPPEEARSPHIDLVRHTLQSIAIGSSSPPPHAIPPINDNVLDKHDSCCPTTWDTTKLGGDKLFMEEIFFVNVCINMLDNLV
ncbi:unnamed protein product [Didymodactylos carnosus]|uniref:Uncharacterized protein n=1 Tax=Didymodactylos carnosus TaxID=1234261 RepID=A0A815SJZ1_9BILA|nr:unnamed protein product [Didymodactylos carnosus]CAF1489867.1 unnamed protein product [Didymodactylos carnosus]CAF4153352.1 unnamed protein product [Didymodactylos carnosus]CAF4353061.1 unnamed protein product [Didymodactylos carnosus]